MTTRPILIIGATGKTGRRIADRLTRDGHPVRLGSRSAAIPFDWEQPESWRPALSGVQAAYIAHYPDLAAAGAVDAIEQLVRIAREENVRKLVLLSGRGEVHAERSERIVAESGLAYTLVRAAWFAQNFSEGMLHPQVMAGQIALPAGSVAEPIVDVDDIADVAAAALTDSRHDGRLYEVTGPELLTFADMADQLAQAAGHPVRYQPITLDQMRGGLLPDLGPAMADLVVEICRQTLDGRNARLGQGVWQALGRAPRSFFDFCQRAAAEGAWRKAA